jgi:hypothetical protein
MRAFIASLVLIVVLGCCGVGFAQQQNDIDPVAVVRRATQNEIAATGPTKAPFFMYKDHTQYRDHSITTEAIETAEGGLNRTLAKNGKPLTAQEQADADKKLKDYAYDKDARRKKRLSNRDDDQRAATLMRSLPDAFNYTVNGVTKAANGHEMVRLGFKAKPGWSAPTHETRVLEGMQGNMLIDKTAGRIAEINGELFKDVDFGWGILGRLFKGGKFIIHQADVGQGKWEETQERLQFSGKILMVKTLTIDSNETMADFRPVPSNVTTAQALQLLQNPDEVVASNGEGTVGKQ